MIFMAGKCTSLENDIYILILIYFNLSAGTYSIDDFNAKIKVSTLQQTQDWEPPQIKGKTGHTRRLHIHSLQ